MRMLVATALPTALVAMIEGGVNDAPAMAR